MLLCICSVGCLSLAETEQCQDATKENFNQANLIFLHYEKSLVSSNLNSKLLWFHCVRPSVDSNFACLLEMYML